jgi:serine/threonine-protein kinase 24/25/MST4
MAPEVIRRSEYDYKADIWSYGITLIELALGNPPHAELDPIKAIHMITKNPPPNLDSTDTRFSRHFRDFLTFVLHDDPGKRPSTEELLKHRFLKSSAASSKKVLKDWLVGWREPLGQLKISPSKRKNEAS